MTVPLPPPVPSPLTLQSDDLQVLSFISAFQPVLRSTIVEYAQLPSEAVDGALKKLTGLSMVLEAKDVWYVTARGQRAVRRSGAAFARDVTRMLYLWRRQRGGRR